MKKKVFFSTVVLLFISIALITITTIFRDYVEVYKFNFEHFSKEYILLTLMSKNTYIDFFSKSDPPNVISWILIGMYIVYTTFDIFGGISGHSTYLQKEKYGSHGTSRWQNKKEIKNYYYKDDLGWFLGHTKSVPFNMKEKYAYHSINSDLNMQINVVGPPGSEKTTGFVYPNIFHLVNKYSKIGVHADLIITDPKSELYSQTADFLESKGYEVRVLDFIHLKYGDSLNIVDFIFDDKTLMESAHGYVVSASAGEGSSGGEQVFWDNQESQVLAALIGFAQQCRPKELQTMAEIVKILTSDEIGSTDKAKDFFKENNIKGAAFQLWNNFLMIADSDRTRANILGGLATKLKLFAIEGIQNITNTTTIDISKFGAKKDKPIALFILMPDGDRTFSPIINTVITTLFSQLYKTAYKYNNKLANPVYFILEEAANIGYIPGLQEKLGTMRGRRIYPMLIWQSLSQMKDRYPKGWEDILSMCDTHVYLGVNDEFTAKYVSNQLGDTTIKVQGMSQKEDGAFKGGKSESLSYQKRKLLLEDEVMRFDVKTSIIRQRGRYPAKLKKVQYKYWESKYRICDFKSLNDLRLLSDNYTLIDFEEKINVKKEEIDRSHMADSRNIENRDKNIEIDNIKTKDIDDIDINTNNKDLEYEIDKETLKRLEKELQEYEIDR